MATVFREAAPTGAKPLSALEEAARRGASKGPGRRFAIGGLVAVGALVYLILTSFSSAVASVESPAQLLRSGVASGQQVRLQGLVVSMDKTDPTTLANRFTVSGGGKTMTVTYAGDLPGGFKTGASVEAQGDYNGVTHTFMALSLTAKCPTKYQASAKSS